MSRNLLGGWTPRDTAHQLQRVTRHSLFVLFGKYGMIALAVLLVIMVFIIPALNDGDDGTRLVFTNIQTGEAMSNPRMMAPRLQGADTEMQPYNISAESAERRDDGAIFLRKIDADITLKSGAWVAVIADEGIFNSEKKTLFLPKNVNIFHNDGMELRTQAAHINLADSTAYGKETVEVQSTLGTLRAEGFKVDMQKKILYFSPRVVVRIHPREE